MPKKTIPSLPTVALPAKGAGPVLPAIKGAATLKPARVAKPFNRKPGMGRGRP